MTEIAPPRTVKGQHVSLSYRAAVRAALKTKKAKKAFRALNRQQRRYFVAGVIQQHARDRHLYRYVTGSVPRTFPDFQPRYYYTWDGEDAKSVQVFIRSNHQAYA